MSIEVQELQELVRQQIGRHQELQLRVAKLEGEWTPPEDTPLRGVKPTKGKPATDGGLHTDAPETERSMKRFTKVEGNWRAAYIEREGGTSCIVPVVMWGSFDEVDKSNGDVLRMGVAAMVLASEDDNDELMFAADRADFLGLLQPGDTENIWDDIAEQRLEAEGFDDKRQERKELEALVGPECPEGFTESPAKGMTFEPTNLDRAYNGDALLVHDHVQRKPHWYLLEARTGGVRDGDGREPVVFELTTPERRMQGQASYTRVRQAEVLGWRRHASRA